MKDSEKIKILQENLRELREENSLLKTQIEKDKSEVLSMRTATEEKQRMMEDVIRAHKEAIGEVREIGMNYRAAIKDANKAKADYEKQMREQLQRIKKQK